MIHPFFTRLITQPGLFAEHVGAYAELATAEVRQFGAVWQKRVVFAVVAAFAALLAIGISAVAAMMVAAIAWDSMPAPWVLVLVPCSFWLLALWCGIVAWRTKAEPMFSLLREQMAVDIDLLHTAGQRP